MGSLDHVGGDLYHINVAPAADGQHRLVAREVGLGPAQSSRREHKCGAPCTGSCTRQHEGRTWQSLVFNPHRFLDANLLVEHLSHLGKGESIRHTGPGRGSSSASHRYSEPLCLGHSEGLLKR